MIPVLLRAEMLVVAILFVVMVFTTVNRQRLRMSDSLIWLLISLGLIVLALVPQLSQWLADLMGIETPANLLYLLGMFFLLAVTFFLTVRASTLSDRVKSLVQTVSIENFLKEESERYGLPRQTAPGNVEDPSEEFPV